jgi:hypothetical protein
VRALFGLPFASFFWYVGLRGFISALGFTTRGTATTGTVIAIVRDTFVLPTRSGWTPTILAHPAVRFESMAGEPITFTNTSGGAYRVGQVVPVLYDRTDPRRAVINSISNLWVGPGLAVTSGATILMLTLWGQPLVMGAVVFLCLVAAALNALVTAGRPAATRDRLPLEFRIWFGAFKALIAGLCGVMTLLLPLGTVSSYSTHAALAREAARYDRAPGCLKPGSADRTAGCHTESARVVGKYSTGQDQRGRPTHYDLRLLRGIGQRSTVEALGPEGYDLWHDVRVGDRVMVQIWKGRLTLVWTGPDAMRTDRNPDYQNSMNTEGLVLLPLFTVVFALLTIGAAFARPLRLRSSPSVAVATPRQPDERMDTAPVHPHTQTRELKPRRRAHHERQANAEARRRSAAEKAGRRLQ